MSKFNIHSANRLPPGPSGMGAKVVQGTLSMNPHQEVVHPEDIKLNTINCLLVVSPGVGTMITVRMFAPGSFPPLYNYASLLAFDMGTTGDPVELDGTLETEFVAFGE